MVFSWFLPLFGIVFGGTSRLLADAVGDGSVLFTRALWRRGTRIVFDSERGNGSKRMPVTGELSILTDVRTPFMIPSSFLLLLFCFASTSLASTAVSFSGRQWLTAAPSFEDRKTFSEIEDFSVDIFFKTSQKSSGDASLLEKWNGGSKASRSGFPFAIRVIPGGRLLCVTYGGKDFKISVTSWIKVNDNEWHTVLCTKLKGVLSLYVDGQLNGQASNFNLPAKSTQNTSPITIGRRGDDKTPCFFNGAIAFVRVASFADNSLTQVLAEHHQILQFKRDGSHMGTVCKRDGILACWAMDDGHGSDFADDGPYGIHAECHDGSRDGSGFTVSTCPIWQEFTLSSSSPAAASLSSDVEAVAPGNETMLGYEHLILAGACLCANITLVPSRCLQRGFRGPD